MPPTDPHAEIESGQLPLELGHTPSHEEADFVVGEGNRLAFLHLTAWPHWPGPLTVLVGPAKAGKSHLSRIWAERARALSPRPEEIEPFAAAGGRQALLIEDVESGAYDERALFHLVNQSMREARPLLLTSRLPVLQWPFATEDLKSRARLATLIEVRSSDAAELSQMLVKLFSDRQIAIEPHIIAYTVSRMERSPAEAVALVALMDKLALARGRAVTRSIAAEALHRRRLERGEEIEGPWEADDERDG